MNFDSKVCEAGWRLVDDGGDDRRDAKIPLLQNLTGMSTRSPKVQRCAKLDLPLSRRVPLRSPTWFGSSPAAVSRASRRSFFRPFLPFCCGRPGGASSPRSPTTTIVLPDIDSEWSPQSLGADFGRRCLGEVLSPSFWDAPPDLDSVTYLSRKTGASDTTPDCFPFGYPQALPGPSLSPTAHDIELNPPITRGPGLSDGGKGAPKGKAQPPPPPPPRSKLQSSYPSPLPVWQGPTPPHDWRAGVVVNWQPMREASRWEGSVWEQVYGHMQRGFTPLADDMLQNAFKRRTQDGSAFTLTSRGDGARIPSLTRKLPRQEALTVDLLYAQLVRLGVSSPAQLRSVTGGIAPDSHEAARTKEAPFQLADTRAEEILTHLGDMLQAAEAIDETQLCEPSTQGGDNSALVPAEEFLRRLLAEAKPLSKLRERVEATLFMIRFGSEADCVESEIKAAINAIETIFTSTAIPVLLQGVLLLGNYVNASSKTLGGAVGVSLDSLAKLAHTRCAPTEQGRVDNALNLLVRQLSQANPGFFETLLTDLVVCRDVRHLDQKIIEDTIKHLDARIDAIRTRASLPYESEALSPERLCEFSVDAASKMKLIHGLLDQLLAGTLALRKWFAEPPSTSFASMMSHLSALRDSLPAKNAANHSSRPRRTCSGAATGGTSRADAVRTSVVSSAGVNTESTSHACLKPISLKRTTSGPPLTSSFYGNASLWVYGEQSTAGSLTSAALGVTTSTQSTWEARSVRLIPKRTLSFPLAVSTLVISEPAAVSATFVAPDKSGFQIRTHSAVYNDVVKADAADAGKMASRQMVSAAPGRQDQSVISKTIESDQSRFTSSPSRLSVQPQHLLTDGLKPEESSIQTVPVTPVVTSPLPSSPSKLVANMPKMAINRSAFIVTQPVVPKRLGCSPRPPEQKSASPHPQVLNVGHLSPQSKLEALGIATKAMIQPTPSQHIIQLPPPPFQVSQPQEETPTLVDPVSPAATSPPGSMEPSHVVIHSRKAAASPSYASGPRRLPPPLHVPNLQKQQ